MRELEKSALPRVRYCERTALPRNVTLYAVLKSPLSFYGIYSGWGGGYEEGASDTRRGLNGVADLPPLASRRMVHRTPVVGALQPVRTSVLHRIAPGSTDDIYQETVNRNNCRSARRVVTVRDEGDSRWSDRLTEGFGGSADRARYPPHRDVNALVARTECVYIYIYIYIRIYIYIYVCVCCGICTSTITANMRARLIDARMRNRRVSPPRIQLSLPLEEGQARYASDGLRGPEF
ncbi:hypothetical protein ALC56_08422 [Trachymyrmex septentrionalis]|uniref:Uncharacterized protein n=1 Tax=Trachymyrmex septentrionalis TaxID=34720 RepID=A0A195F8U3_9HYME|nr:hypothetical protein ALC56_08422 [Trachymyrmex septentrionalis]